MEEGEPEGEGETERTILNKGDIGRNAKTTGSRVITTVTLVLGTVIKKDTRNGLGRELRPLTR